MSDDTREALAVARELIEMGVPVFVARQAMRDGARDWKGGTGGTGYHLPGGWQATVPSTAVLDTWRPGDALCAVMGRGLDLLDVDPRNGGDASQATLQDRGVWPTAYGVATTPSGGSHEFVKSIGVRSRDGVLPGLDVKAGVDGKGIGFGFIAPTEKLSKATGEVGKYTWVTLPRRPDGSDNSGVQLAAEIANLRNTQASSHSGAVVGRIGDPIPQGKHHEEIRNYVWRYRCRLTEPETLVLALRRASDCRPSTWSVAMTTTMVREAYQKSPDSGPPYSWTETGNAERVLDVFGGRLHYCAAVGWLAWDGVCWVVCERGEVGTAIVASAKAAKRGAEDDERRHLAAGDQVKADLAHAAAAWWGSSLASLRITATENILKILPGVQISTRDLDTHPMLLACANGTVELQTGTLRHNSPDDLLTVAMELPFVAGASSPKWVEFLRSCFPSRPDMPRYLQLLTGYGITGDSSEQIYVIHHGSGANGKSVFTSTLHKVFGPVTKAIAIESLLARRGMGDASAAAPDIAALRSARLVVTSEAEHGSKLSEARVKSLTGGDPITVRTLYREPFTFTPGFLIMLSTNALPDIRGRDEGIWRRTKVLDWEEEFLGDRANHSLQRELLAEAEGVLAWAVEGARLWHAQGLGEPPTMGARVAEYRAQTDVLAGFFPGVLVDDVDGFMARGDVYNAYVAWTEEEGLQRNEVWRREALFKALRERRVCEVRRHADRGFSLAKPKPTKAVHTPPVVSTPSPTTNVPSLRDVNG